MITSWKSESIEAWQFNLLGPSEQAPQWLMDLFSPETYRREIYAANSPVSPFAAWELDESGLKRSMPTYPYLVIYCGYNKMQARSTDWVVNDGGAIFVLTDAEFQSATINRNPA